MFVQSYDRGGSSGGRQKYLDKVSFLEIGGMLVVSALVIGSLLIIGEHQCAIQHQDLE